VKIVLATTNRGKAEEFRELLKDFKILTQDEILEPFKIVEDGSSFAENALIKARATYEKLKRFRFDDKSLFVLADDSGISLPVLNGEPGIFSARYAGTDATDRDNLNRLVESVKSIGLTESEAYYTASIALVTEFGEYVVHGWMYGKVVDSPRGDRGFGYDPIFIPKGFNRTLGELESKVKSKISHRVKAIENIRPILKMLQRGVK
jgi:XTP/dITP diphosphohydrolase